jgi:hypothetical protein
VVAILPLRETVIVAVWFSLNEPLLAVKLDVIAPAGTVSEPGIVNMRLLLCNATTAPLGPAADFSVTVQVLDEFCPRLVGLHATPETSTGASRLMVAVLELLPRVAVTIAL